MGVMRTAVDGLALIIISFIYPFLFFFPHGLQRRERLSPFGQFPFLFKKKTVAKTRRFTKIKNKNEKMIDG